MSDLPLNPSTNLALVAGKVSAATIRLLNAGMGSNLPGKLARQLSPQILSDLSAQPRLGTIAITGTNGKSTTAGLLSSILRVAGFKLVHNRQGANLVTGITASLIDAADWRGNIDADYGLFEIDEAALPVVAREIRLNTAIVTNLFRDQLDRFGELDTTARLITKGITENHSLAVLNADDPNVCQLISEGKRFFYGIESDSAQEAPQHQLAELSYCAVCGNEIGYESITYGQLGKWRCNHCDHRRPQPDFYASAIKLSAAFSSFVLHNGTESLNVRLELPGLFNIYNAVAAGAAASILGIALETIKEGLKEYDTLFGRSERVKIQGKTVLIQLIKNPAGATQAINTISRDNKVSVMIAINDNLADGRDVSWLWDADFEPLAALEGVFIVSGQRAEDMAIRLKYANIKSERIVVIPSLQKALKEVLDRTSPDTLVWILPTYTCLLELQKIIQKLGVKLSGT